MTFNHCFNIHRFFFTAVLTIGTSFVPSAFAGNYFIIDTDSKIWARWDDYRTHVVDINNAGQVAGYSPMPPPGGGAVAWLTGPNGEGEISNLGPSHLATAVNDIGQMAGYINPDESSVKHCENIPHI